MMGLLQRHPAASTLICWSVHLGLSVGGYCLAVMLAVGFMDSGGVVPPAWLRVLFGLVQYGLLQPLAYWVLAASPSPSDWGDLSWVVLVCAVNSAIATAVVAGALRFFIVLRRSG